MRELCLPYPPSVNHVWRMVHGRMLLSREGRRFRDHVQAILAARREAPLEGRLALVADVAPPDRRRRDIDNVQKTLLDALEKGGAYRDDSQIDLLVARRQPPVEGGACGVRLTPWPAEVCPLCGARHDGRTVAKS
jgi:crossover junction endodeoxyribonuclease RusA